MEKNRNEIDLKVWQMILKQKGHSVYHMFTTRRLHSSKHSGREVLVFEVDENVHML